MWLRGSGGGAMFPHAEGAGGAPPAGAATRRGRRGGRGERRRHDTGGRYRSVYLYSLINTSSPSKISFMSSM